MALEDYAALTGRFDPLAVDQKIAETRNAQNANRLADFAFSEKQRDADENSRLNDLYRNSLDEKGLVDRNSLESGLARSGLGTKILPMRKSFAEQDKMGAEADEKKSQTKKQNAEADKISQETASHQFEIAGQLAGAWAKDPTVTKDKIQRGMNAALNSKIISPDVYDAKSAELQKVGDDPQSLNGWAKDTLMQVMKAKDQFAMTTPDANTVLNNKTSSANNAATNATSRANNAATVGAAILGHTLVNDRAKEAGLAPEYKQDAEGNWIALPKKVPNGGSIIAQPVMGEDGKPLKAAPKPATEFQGKSAAYGARAEQADKIISELTGKYSPAAVNAKQGVGNTWLVGGALEAGANGLLSEDGQRAEQAQRDFINAVLRQESGAAISPSEFDNAKKQYFPQPNDKKDALIQKAENRKLAIQGFKNSAGKAYFSANPSAINTGKPSLSEIFGK